MTDEANQAMSYEEARARVEKAVNARMAGVRRDAKHRMVSVDVAVEHATVPSLPLSTLRALLAGPPEPSEEESPHLRIAEIAVGAMRDQAPALGAYDDDEIASFEASVAMSIRAEVQQLYRSRR